MTTSSLRAAEKIFQTFTVLPTIPVAAAKAVQLLNQPDVDLSDVSDILLADQVMTARIIRIINSPLYRLMQDVDSVKSALIYLGPQKIFEIILTSCFLELTDSRNSDGITIKKCWEHALGVGLVARRLAEENKTVATEQAYVAGILHDIGIVILSQQRSEEFKEVMRIVREDDLTIHAAEMLVFGTSHAEVGAVLARQWSFPASFVEVIMRHHDSSVDELSLLTRIVIAANRICVLLGLECGIIRDFYGENTELVPVDPKDMEECLSALGVDNHELFSLSIEDVAEKVRETVKNIYS